MDNDIVNRTINSPNYQTFGKKVFWLFFLQSAPLAFIILIISFVLFILSFQPFLITTPFGNIQDHILQASLIIFATSLLLILLSLAYARMTYMNYTFLMGDDSLKIKRGILSKTENAIPYRQIQNVDIERDFMFQMLGLSRLIILTAGHEDESTKSGSSSTDEAEGVIPAIDEKLASLLQTELLKRADIQKVSEMK